MRSHDDATQDRLCPGCSTDAQDLTAQREQLGAPGVDQAHIYVDHGLTGRNRPVPDARDIVSELTDEGVAPNIGGAVHDPSDPIGRLLLNVLAMIAEADLISARTREGLAVARSKGKLRGRSPKLSTTQEKRLVDLWETGEWTSQELADDFGVSRSTLWRAVERAKKRAPVTSVIEAR